MDMPAVNITFARESYADLIDDIEPMLAEHHAELALYRDEIPLDPEFEAYHRADRLGLMRFYAARRVGVLIGYAIFSMLERHHHYAHRWAINDILWIDPEHRNLGVGNGLFDVFEADLRGGGPIVIHIETKEMAPALAALCLARGYGPVGMSYSKRFA
jgi:GNAT superfamily N-acetyltransferase